MESQYRVASFYKFKVVEAKQLEADAKQLYALAEASALCGLIILAPEGINATVAAPERELDSAIDLLAKRYGLEAEDVKYSECASKPFRRFKVKLRSEIVTSGVEQLDVLKRRGRCLTPAEWHQLLASGEEVTLLDVRNDYETRLGTFRGAVDPELSRFQEFPDYVANGALPKDKPVLMYCTGGIRCEKASLEMERQGYDEVYQLEGGILRYLEEYPEGFFEGECFVFDHRVAVDRELRPSTRYQLCPHCGDPGAAAIECTVCGSAGVVCEDCLALAPERRSCSKNCAHHAARRRLRALDVCKS